MGETPGTGRRLAILGLALAALVLIDLLPQSGMGWVSLANWQDQGYFLRAATMAGETGAIDETLRPRVGPGYAALAVLAKRATGLDYDGALILLGRLSLLAGAACALLYAARRQGGQLPGMAIPGIVFTTAAIGLSGWPYASDIPWSHFTAAALLAALIATADGEARSERIRLVLAGMLFGLLWQVRAFEGMVFAIAAAIAIVLVLLTRRPDWREWLARLPLRAMCIVLGCALSLVAVGAVTGSWLPFAQYSDESPAKTALLLSLLPERLVQLFWDPCYKTLCSVTDYHAVWSPGGTADVLASWKQPLFAQVPAVLGGLVALAVLLASAPRVVARLPFGVLLAAGTAMGLIIGYGSAMPSGAPHLKYGFFRDFVAPLLLLTMAFVGATRTVDSLVPGRGGTLRLAAAYAVAFAIVAGGWAVNFTCLPRLGADVAEFRLTADCGAETCRLGLEARGAGGPLPFDERSYVLLACADGPRELFGPVPALDVPRDCSSAAILPALSGFAMTPEERLFLDNPVPLRDGTSTVGVR